MKSFVVFTKFVTVAMIVAAYVISSMTQTAWFADPNPGHWVSNTDAKEDSRAHNPVNVPSFNEFKADFAQCQSFPKGKAPAWWSGWEAQTLIVDIRRNPHIVDFADAWNMTHNKAGVAKEHSDVWVVGICH